MAAQVRRKGHRLQAKTFSTRARAEKWAREIEVEIDNGVFVSRVEAETTTLKALLGRYMAEITPLKMGAAVMNRAGVEPAAQAAPFAAQILALYETGLGAWAKPVVGASVISVMLTTTLAGLDALPRVLVAITRVLRGRALGPGDAGKLDRARYRVYLIALSGGAIAALYLLASSFRAFLDFGTTIAFLSAPVIAVLNHRAVFGSHVLPADRPAPSMRLWSLTGIAVLAPFSAFYLYLLLGGFFG